MIFPDRITRSRRSNGNKLQHRNKQRFRRPKLEIRTEEENRRENALKSYTRSIKTTRSILWRRGKKAHLGVVGIVGEWMRRRIGGGGGGIREDTGKLLRDLFFQRIHSVLFCFSLSLVSQIQGIIANSHCRGAT